MLLPEIIVANAYYGFVWVLTDTNWYDIWINFFAKNHNIMWSNISSMELSVNYLNLTYSCL